MAILITVLVISHKKVSSVHLFLYFLTDLEQQCIFGRHERRMKQFVTGVVKVALPSSTQAQAHSDVMAVQGITPVHKLYTLHEGCS